MFFIHPCFKVVGNLSEAKEQKFRKKCNQQQLSYKRRKLSGVNFFSGPSMQWVRWVESDFVLGF